MNSALFAVNGAPVANGAPKRSNSGREIVYWQNQRIIGSNPPIQEVFTPPPLPTHVGHAPPEDVQQVFNTVFRKYSFKDLYRWLKQDRQNEIDRSSMLPHSTPEHFGTRPSLPSSNRTSCTSSVFSVPQYDRHSVASSHTSYSMMSDPGVSDTLSPNHQMQAAHVVQLNQQNANIATSSPPARTSRNNSVASSRPSVRQRDSELEGKKRYFCTACNKGFARKYDWKVHEQRYHEQQSQFPCPDCNQIMYAETHFRSHHRDAHGCQQCTHGKTVSREVDARRRRTAWGCGFCGDLLDDWEKRCDHISAHYDEGHKRTEWDHSKVIVGLLRQPEIDDAWRSLLIERHGQCPKPPVQLRWSKDTTSRSHGDSLQLQDWLELGAITRDVQMIVQLAYDQGYRPNLEGTPTPQDSKPEPNDEFTDSSGPDPIPEEDTPAESSESIPLDAVMASPLLESSQPQTTTYFLSNNPVLSNFQSHSTPPQHQDQTSQDQRGESMPATVDPAWSGFTSPSHIFPGQYINAGMAPFVDKALPPTPVDIQNDVQMMPPSQHPQSGVDDAQASFDTWTFDGSFDGSTLHNEPNAFTAYGV